MCVYVCMYLFIYVRRRKKIHYTLIDYITFLIIPVIL